MRRVILLSSVVVTGWMFGGFGESGEAVAQCVATTDCAMLGYTETSCSNGGLKCPFGNTWSCKETATTSSETETPTKATLGRCNGYAKNCQLGWLLNSDGTCTENKVSGKTPIGVIVYLSLRGCGQAMTVEPIVTGISWASSEVTYGSSQIVVGTSVDLGEYDEVMASYDGYENTLMIINKGDKTAFPAAWAAYEYTPNSVPETKGKWFLPAVGVLQNVYDNLGVINQGINKMGGAPLVEKSGSIGFLSESIWSSSETNVISAWCLVGGPYKTGILNVSKTVREGKGVRPVIEF